MFPNLSVYYKAFSKYILLVFVLLFISQESFSQSYKKHPNINGFTVYTLPHISQDSIQLLVEENPNMFAYPFYVDIKVLDNAASWIIDDTINYLMCFTSKGAYTLNVIFEKSSIPKGATLELYNPSISGSEVYFNQSSFSKNGVFASPLINGDSICILYKEPLNSLEKGNLTITQISHDFKNSDSQKSLLKADAAPCNVNINCVEGSTWQQEKRAVCRLIINGQTLCTGTLINNTAFDLTPYVITANHCLKTQKNAEKTVFQFGYEYENCEGTGAIVENRTISGADLVATDSKSKIDFTLLKMSSIPHTSYRVYYAGWDNSVLPSSNSSCIHHPRGDVKKISKDYDSYKSATFLGYLQLSDWKVDKWDVGTTESGSSGAPLFNKNHQIIGTLSGGEADCANPVNDYFSKFSVAWDYYSKDSSQLKKWLDPGDKGLSFCRGFDPLFDSSTVISNIISDDLLVIPDFGTEAQGLWSGVNELGWNQFADYFSWTTNKTIYAITLVAKIDTTQDLSQIKIKVWEGDGKPETVLYEVSLEKSMIKDSSLVFVVPDVPIQTTGSYWVGYEILNNSNALQAYIAEPRDYVSTLYVNHPKSWVNTNELGTNTSLALQIYVTNQPDTLPSIITYEIPTFYYRNFSKFYTHRTKELFDIDSIQSLYDTTLYVNVYNSKIENNWSGVSDKKFHCFANSYKISDPFYLQSLKLAINTIPSTDIETELVVWDENFNEVLATKSISNSLLREKYYNQVNFDNPILILNTCNIGICYDTSNYKDNLSIFQFYDNFYQIDGYFKTNNNWFSYRDFDVMYNMALQPITCFSKYYFNRDSLIVKQYPITNYLNFELLENNEYIIYPNPCIDYSYIKFLKSFHEDVKITIYNDHGVVVESKIIQNQNSIFEVPTIQLPEGFYIIKIEVAGQTYLNKIIKVKKL